MKPMIVSVPAQPEWVLVLRMAAAGTGALYDLPVDLMEDLRTAIEESCELMLHQALRPETLTMTCEKQADGFHVILTALDRHPQQEENPADADIARLIIQTLVREAALEQDEGGVYCVQMTLPAGE